jgi:hypothetical protein
MILCIHAHTHAHGEREGERERERKRESERENMIVILCLSERLLGGGRGKENVRE